MAKGVCPGPAGSPGTSNTPWPASFCIGAKLRYSVLGVVLCLVHRLNTRWPQALELLLKLLLKYPKVRFVFMASTCHHSAFSATWPLSYSRMVFRGCCAPGFPAAQEMAVLHLDNVCTPSPGGTRGFLKSGLRLERNPKSQAVCLALLGAESEGPSCSVRYQNQGGEPSATRTVCAQQTSVPGYVLMV